MMQPTELSIPEAGRALRDGRLRAVDLLDAHLDLVARRDPTLRAFVTLTQDAAHHAATRADTALSEGADLGPLMGIPFAIKDLIDVEGTPSSHGARGKPPQTPARSATVVQRLLAAGAVPLGLVATYELGIVGPSADGAYPPALNPWSPAHITGGSSSGSAAAVAAGLVRFAIGTDTGGSIRSPASYCGVTGLKPTFGSLPRDGVLPLSPSLDHIGVIARSAAEALLVFQAMAGTAPTDLPPDIATLRVGYARGWFATDHSASPAVVDLMDAAISQLTLIGATSQLIALPDYAVMEAAGAVLIHAEGLTQHAASVTGTGPTMGRMAYQSMIAGAALTPQDQTDSHRAARRLRAEIDTALHTCDVLIMPTTLTSAPAVAAFADGTAVWTPMRTLPFNVTGHPALSTPMGFVGGLPVGMQIVGRHGAEHLITAVGAAFEAATGHSAQRPYWILSRSNRNCAARRCPSRPSLVL
ncbi:MAG: amidase [Paracoccaceae bacterium]